MLINVSSPVLHRCIPTGKNAPGEQVVEMYDLVNSWSAAQQALSDLYVTWPFILLMSFGALRKFTLRVNQSHRQIMMFVFQFSQSSLLH